MGFIEVFASEVYLAAVGSGDGGDDADGGGFTCAIGAEHPEDGAGLYFKADFIHGEVVSVAFGYFVKSEYGHMWDKDGKKAGSCQLSAVRFWDYR